MQNIFDDVLLYQPTSLGTICMCILEAICLEHLSLWSIWPTAAIAILIASETYRVANLEVFAEGIEPETGKIYRSRYASCRRDYRKLRASTLRLFAGSFDCSGTEKCSGMSSPDI